MEKRINEKQLEGLIQRDKVRTVGYTTPLNDLIEHIPHHSCQCKPELYFDNELDAAYIRHTALDGRVAVEQANSILGIEANVGGWEATVDIIPLLCRCPNCEEEREEGPDLYFIHEVFTDMMCELLLTSSGDMIQKMEEADHKLNLFTGLSNTKKD
jgi:hypothetical protein